MGPEDQVSDEDREKARLLRRMLEAQNKLDAQGAAKVPQGYKLLQETPDGGKIYKAPDGKLSFTSSGYATNNQAEILRMMQGATPGAARRSETNKEIVQQSGWQAGAASAIQGLPFIGQYFDEAAGMASGDPRVTSAIRENAAAYQEQKPLEAFAGQAALGTVATLPLVPFQAAGRALQAVPTLGQKLLTGLGVGVGGGAIEGGVSGFGAGEGSAEERMPSAGMGAGMGGVLGGLFGLAAPAVEAGVKNALQFWGDKPIRDMAKQFGISPDAAKVVLAAIQDNDIPTAQAALQRAGSTSMLGEATQGTKNLLDAAIAMGSGTDRAQQALLARNLRGEQEMRAAFDRFLGNPEDIKDVTGKIRLATKEEREQLYNAAYDKQIDYSTLTGQQLQNLLRLVPPEALRYAEKIRRMDPNARAPQIVFTEGPDGSVSFGAKAAEAAPSTVSQAPQSRSVASVTTKDGRQYDVTAEVFKDRDAVVMSPMYPSNITDDLTGAIDHQKSALRAQERGMSLANDAPRAPDWATQNPKEWGDVQRQVGERFLGMVNSTPGPHVLALVDGIDINSLATLIEDGLPKGKVIMRSPGNGELAVVNRGQVPEQFARWETYSNLRFNQKQGILPPPAEWANAKPAATSAPSNVTPPPQGQVRVYRGVRAKNSGDGADAFYTTNPDVARRYSDNGEIEAFNLDASEFSEFDAAGGTPKTADVYGTRESAKPGAAFNNVGDLEIGAGKTVYNPVTDTQFYVSDPKRLTKVPSSSVIPLKPAPKPTQGAAPASPTGTPQTRFNVEQWDLITRGLNEMAYGSPAGAMGGKSEIQSLAAKNAREIRKIIMDQVPEYRAALGLARDTIEEVKSAEVGFNLLNGGTTVKEVKDMLSGNNPAAVQSMKLGLRSGLDHALGNLKVSAANPNTNIKELMAGLSSLRSRNNMSKVRALLGDADADEFYKVLDEQATGIELAAAVAANSKTAQRLSVGRSVEEIAAPGILGSLLRAEPVNASRMVVQSITGKTPEADAARRMGLYDDIATLLTRVQGQNARDALNLIERAKAGKALNDVQAAIIAKAVTMPAAISTYKAMTNAQVKPVRPQEATYGRQTAE